MHLFTYPLNQTETRPGGWVDHLNCGTQNKFCLQASFCLNLSCDKAFATSSVILLRLLIDVYGFEFALLLTSQSEYCDCGSTLGVTEAAARKIYKHLGFSSGRDALAAEGYRETALHIWGTHNLSTEDVLSWVTDYNPVSIEWINDASCMLS